MWGFEAANVITKIHKHISRVCVWHDILNDIGTTKKFDCEICFRAHYAMGSFQSRGRKSSVRTFSIQKFLLLKSSVKKNKKKTLT